MGQKGRLTLNALPEYFPPEIAAKTRILLADDDAEFLAEIQDLLCSTYDVVGALPNGRALLNAARTIGHDLIISDISMPGMSGLEVASKVNALGLTSGLIFLSVHSSPAYLKRAHSLGAKGYVLKTHAAEQLLEAVSTVLAGESFVSPQIDSLFLT